MLTASQVIQLRDGYLCDALSLSDKEYELVETTRERLPSEIIDAHTHSAMARNIIAIDDRAYSHMLSTFPCFTVSESERLSAIFYPNIHVRQLRFGFVFRGVDYRSMNKDLLDMSPPNDRVALFGVQDDLEYTIEELSSRKYVALKMYYLYPQTTATTILEIFPQKVLKAAESLDIPIILHLPLSKPISFFIDEIVELKQRYPKLRACICHLGSTEECSNDVAKAMETFATETDFVMDSALNHNKDSIRKALDYTPNKGETDRN